MSLQKIVWILLLMTIGCQSQKRVQDDYYDDTSHPAQETFDSRVQYLIMHYTAVDEGRSFDLLTRPDWPASAHYLVTEYPKMRGKKPVVYGLVDEKLRAWQAGKSYWAGNTNLNSGSIGIEIVNFGYIDAPDPNDDNAIYALMLKEERISKEGGISQAELMKQKSSWLYAEDRYWFPFTAEQTTAVIALAKGIAQRHDIPPEHILGHMDIAPQRKHDPGPLFPWQELYDAGVGAWYLPEAVEWYVQDRPLDQEVDPQLLLKALKVYGYEIPEPLDERIPKKLLKPQEVKQYEESRRMVIRAFQMHFRPSNFSGIADVESEAIALALVERYKGADVALALLRK
ncbi:N-acetylmuramoyl-L-alanine amidase [Entomospira culicis]|nr:N-acetylmuramoyl-L-alanine amidase [Entomospira culicis]WDI37159.1 N-acetylmuramoyl-L-alanine amidase [Entomospira culicis]